MKRVLVICAVAAALTVAGSSARASGTACPVTNAPNELVLVGGSGQQAQLGKPFAQSLQVSGSFRGKVSTAEVKECGVSDGSWYLQLSGMSVGVATGSLSLTVPQYAGPSTYQPQGSLMLIVNQQASFLGATGGSVTIDDPHSGSMDVTFTGGGSTSRVSGTWACPG